MRLKFFVFIQFSCSVIYFGEANDIVVNSTVTPHWSSLMFIIPMDLSHQYFSPTALCNIYSDYYCLLAYFTENNGKTIL